MSRKCTLAGMLLLAASLALAGLLAAAEPGGFDAAHRVTFRSGATPFDKLNFNEPHDDIAGYLYRPGGDGPFAAVVLEADLQGLTPVQQEWAQRLVAWGYVALAVDSHSRSVNRTPTGTTTSHDAYGALRYLAAQPFVDARRVAWIGWSIGGGAAMLRAGGMDTDPQHPGQPMAWLVSEGPWRFQAGIALYPECPGSAKTYYAPILLLVPAGGTRGADACKSTVEQSTAGGQPVQIRIYPDTTLYFDTQGVKLDFYGEPARYDPTAAADAVVRVKGFLQAHLGQKASG